MGGIFSMDGFDKDINDLIIKLGRMDARAGEMELIAGREAASILEDEQKRIIGAHYPKLASRISTVVETNSRQGVRFKIGYNNDDFSTLPEAYITEFGRPGVKRNGINLKGNKIGVRKKGAPRAISHIRAAVFLKKELVLRRFDELVLKAMVEEWEK